MCAWIRKRHRPFGQTLDRRSAARDLFGRRKMIGKQLGNGMRFEDELEENLERLITSDSPTEGSSRLPEPLAKCHDDDD